VAGVAAANAAPVNTRRHPLITTRTWNNRKPRQDRDDVSAICLGGHWKRVHHRCSARKLKTSVGYSENDMENIQDSDFLKAGRRGQAAVWKWASITYDACAGHEIMAYSRVLRERRRRCT